MPYGFTIVDDAEDFRILFDLLIQHRLGVSVLGLPNLGAVIENSTDVLQSLGIVLDINLGAGDADGVEVYKWLHAKQYKGPVWFLTSYPKNSPKIQHAVETGVPVLEKPMNLDAMIREFGRAVEVRVAK